MTTKLIKATLLKTWLKQNLKNRQMIFTHSLPPPSADPLDVKLNAKEFHSSLICSTWQINIKAVVAIAILLVFGLI